MLPLLLAAALDLDVDPLPETTAPAARAWWVPSLTLRLTRREGRSLAVERDLEVRATPWGTTLELRLEWGAPALVDAPSETP